VTGKLISRKNWGIYISIDAWWVYASLLPTLLLLDFYDDLSDKIFNSTDFIGGYSRLTPKGVKRK